MTFDLSLTSALSFPPAVALLSSPGPESVQNRVARALANLALEPDGARDVLDAGEQRGTPRGPEVCRGRGRVPRGPLGGRRGPQSLQGVT